MSVEEFLKLFERGVVALERLADNRPTPAQVVAGAIETARKPRGKAKAAAQPEIPGGTEVKQEDIPAQPLTEELAQKVDEALGDTPVPSDEEMEEELEQEVAPVPTIDDMRNALRTYQMATSPKDALALLSRFDGATVLSKVPEHMRAAMVAACKAGTP